MRKDIEKILLTPSEIKTICIDLGKQITHDYKEKKPLLIGLLKGCVPFLSELSQHIDLYLEIEYLSVSSYHGNIKTSGDIKIRKDSDTSFKGRDVLIVEDIIDTGYTLKTVHKLFLNRGAKSVKVVTLLDKPDGRKTSFKADYVGKVIPNEFVVGFGLDFKELYRNLPFVGVLKKSVYTKGEQ